MSRPTTGSRMVFADVKPGFTSLLYNGLTVRVSSDDSSHVSWLQEFLTPQFQIAGQDSCDCSVTVVVSDRRFEEFLERGPDRCGARVDCFALDGRIARFPLWSAPGDERVVFDEECGVFYILTSGTTEIGLLARAGNASVRTALMRVVRELAMNHSLGLGCMIVHGAAVAVENRAVILAGPKASGKTTLLIHLLQVDGASFVSNDRLVVAHGESGPTVRGLPTIVKVPARTLEMFPLLRQRLSDSPCHYRLAVGETRMGSRGRPRVAWGGHASLSPAQFCALLQVGAVASCGVGTLVFPEVTGQPGGIVSRELSAEEAADRLMESLSSGWYPQRGSGTFIPIGSRQPDRSDRATLRRACLRITSQVCSVACRLGLSAYKNVMWPRSLLRRVAGA
jgi:hypothetical protein